MKVIVIGGVAAGPKVAARLMRIMTDVEVTLIEKGTYLSYAGCGLPYYVAGVIEEQKELMATPVGVVRDAYFFEKVKDFKVLNQTEVIAIDRTSKKVKVKDLQSGEEKELAYDKLVLATGSNSIIPPLEGIKADNIFKVQQVEDAEHIKQYIKANNSKTAVIVGAGLIGLEMAEAFHSLGLKVTIIEKLPQILPILDEELSFQLHKYLKSKGVDIKTGTTVQSFSGSPKVMKVITDQGEIEADLVVMSIGVRPNVGLAKEAGLEIGKTGGIKVSEQQQTSDPDIFAVGDCVEMVNRITGQPCYVPLGSTANKQGRIAANSIAGRQDKFPGVLGTAVCKVLDMNVGRTGLGEEQAKNAGYDVEIVLSPAPDKAHYYPTARPIMLKMIVDKKSRQLLGLQGVGIGAVDKRIDVAATAITVKMTIEDIAHLDLGYAPPYSPAMDNIIVAADIARNKLDGLVQFISPKEVLLKKKADEDFILLDVRSDGEYQQMSIPDSVLIPLGQLRSRLNELPKDKEIIAFCKISLRGYEAALILQKNGFQNVKIMDGGILMWMDDIKK